MTHAAWQNRSKVTAAEPVSLTYSLLQCLGLLSDWSSTQLQKSNKIKLGWIFVVKMLTWKYLLWFIAHKIKSIYFLIHHAPPGSVVDFAVVFSKAKERCRLAAGLRLGSSDLETCSSKTKDVAWQRVGCFETTSTQCYISSFGKGTCKQRS